MTTPLTLSSLETWRVLWAKSDPFHPLWKHMLDAAAVSLALRNPVARDGWPDETLAWLVALHDVGKADPCFQHQEKETTEELEIRLWDAEQAGKDETNLRRLRMKLGAARASEAVRNVGLDAGEYVWYRHELFSAHFIRNALENAGADEFFFDSAGRAVAAHHGHWDEPKRSSPDRYKEVQRQLSSMIRDTLTAPPFPSQKPADLSAFGMRVAGHVVLCDWIASNEAFFGRDALRECDDPAEYLKRARGVAAELVEQLGLQPDPAPGQPERVVDSPRPLQRMLLEEPLAPGLVLIEAPMGEGKTEAAWILAEQWRDEQYVGAYMALPTQSTGDAIFARYEADYLRRLAREEKVHLIHGMAWLRDGEEPDHPFVTHGEPVDGGVAGKRDEDAFAAQWFRPTRRAMLAAHGAGTVDQFLLAGLNARFGFLRLYGLDRRVLIVDEVHAYDAYMTAILRRGLEWCAAMRIPVVLLSATLSAGQRAQLVAAYGARESDRGPHAPYPLISHVSFAGEVRTLQPAAVATRTLTLIPCLGLLGDVAATARLAERLASEGRCVCVLVNTVRQAQRVFRELRLGRNEKGLFHARYTTADREARAADVIRKFGKECGERPERFVLVATQVVEQSLDVDFDVMLSELAPVDLLLQRSGRVHRHVRDAQGRIKPEGVDERGDPVLHVVLPPDGELRFGGTERVYDRYVLLRTLALVRQEREVVLPRDFRLLIEAVYGEGEIPSGVVERALPAAKQQWEAEISRMESAAEPYLLQPPKARFFRPVRNTPVGDDSDDGTGWRAQTRLGMNDRTCLFIREQHLERTRSGAFPLHVVRDLYRKAVRVPGYVRLDQPAEGCGTAVEGAGALRGMTLIPYTAEREWKGDGWTMRYDEDLGLLVERG